MIGTSTDSSLAMNERSHMHCAPYFVASLDERQSDIIRPPLHTVQQTSPGHSDVRLQSWRGPTVWNYSVAPG